MNEKARDPSQLPPERARLRLRDAARLNRFEAVAGADEVAAVIDYTVTARGVRLDHTEVQPGYEGRGISSWLVKAVFDEARARDFRLIPRCPFILRWLERHPEQHGVLAAPLGPPGSLPPAGPIEPA